MYQFQVKHASETMNYIFQHNLSDISLFAKLSIISTNNQILQRKYHLYSASENKKRKEMKSFEKKWKQKSLVTSYKSI